MFGAPIKATPASGTSLFGDTKDSKATNKFDQAASKDSGNTKSLFGGASTFKPASNSSLFGSSTTTATSLFGNTTGGKSLFD